jgi:hypothetical protein
MKNRLFPDIPKDLAKLTDEELADILARADKAAELIDGQDAEFLADFTADEIIEQYREGKDLILSLRGETQKRVEDAERFQSELSAIGSELKAETDEPKPEGDDDEPKPDDEPAEPEAKAETDEPAAEVETPAEPEVADPVKEKVLVAAAEEPETPADRPMRRNAPAPKPAEDRVVVNEPEPKRLAFVAAGSIAGVPPGAELDRKALAAAVEKVMRSSRVNKSVHGREENVLVASLDYSDRFPEDRWLRVGDAAGNGEKVRLIHEMFAGSSEASEALVASGGICAPPENIYTMPQLATSDRPVRGGLPNFRADRGAINVPVPTTIGDAAGAITVITADEDGEGGTFATKACLDMSCPDYVATAVTVISHCREFGNLNAMSWPEKIAHENELTMAEHARIAESYLLGRLKTLSVNVTNGAQTLGALIYLVDAIMKAKYGIRSRLRLPAEARFRAFLPRVLGDMLELDTVSTQFDRYRSLGAIEAFLAEKGIDVTWYLDTPLQVGDATAAPGDSQIADAAQAAGALEAFPSTIQWAIHPAGTFLHEDMASLELGIVRDSTLNSTNDFQIFGESFENVALIGPAQAAYWVTSTLCADGQFPPAGTARTCP